MAAITGAAIAATATLGSAAMSANSAKNAARAQQRGTEAATAAQQQQFEQMMQMTAPRRQIEGNALNMLAQMTGVPGADGSGGGAPDYSAFFNSPDYQFALQQGEQSAMRGGSAMGNLRSGNTLAALTQYGQGLASQQFGNYITRLNGLANMGATDNAAAAMVGQGDRVASNLMGGANARASGIAGAANSWNGAANSLAQLGGYAMSNPGMFGGSGPKMSPTIQNAGAQMPPGGTPPYAGYGGQNYLYRGGYNA